MTAVRSVLPLTELIGESQALRQAVALADRYAPSSLSVLIAGETGTGKELIAQRIHQVSGRRGSLVDLNCGAFPAEMLECLLFGHRRGAFTGAIEEGKGLISAADAGTLFLDELSSLPLAAQTALLRVLATREVRRLGDTTNRTVDFRLIAAVQGNLAERVRAGQFRADLLHRVAGVVVELPPLRDRADDIPLLASHFASLNCVHLGSGVVDRLREYSWPGNVRELRTVIDRASFGMRVAVLSVEAIDAAMAQSRLISDPAGSRAMEAGHAERLLEACGAAAWDMDVAAESLGISRATLYRRLKANGIEVKRTGRLSRDETVSPNLTPAAWPKKRNDYGDTA